MVFGHKKTFQRVVKKLLHDCGLRMFDDERWGHVIWVIYAIKAREKFG